MQTALLKHLMHRLDRPLEQIEPLIEALFSRLPKEDFSGWIGEISQIPLPKGPVRVLILRAFAKAFGIDLNQAEKQVSEYSSISELFSRKLSPGTRPLESGLVSPVDGLIVAAGSISEQASIEQGFCDVKGQSESLVSLLGSVEQAQKFVGGSFVTVYLCPADYHRVHAPLDFKISWGQCIGGELWPVGSFATSKIKGLYSRNRRVALVGKAVEVEATLGDLALVLVGATNVGSLRMTVANELNAERQTRAPLTVEFDSQSAQSQKGDELGYFAMGSTVVMLLSEQTIERLRFQKADFSTWIGRNVRMGQSLAH